MPKVFHFLQYNNAVPIAISIVLLGSAGAFAATDPSAVYSQQQQVLSVDNTYLVNKDLSTYSPKILITGVTEDSDNYYVNYTLYTIDLQNYVWQDVTRTDTMTVSKADLGPYRDLGVYVEGKMDDIVGRELDRLKETQADARNSVSQEVVATAYGGIIGKFLDSSTQTLPGYTPVVTPPAPPSQVASAAASDSGNNSDTLNTSSTSNTSTGPGPTLQILGNNPAQIPIGSSYVDLGAVIVDPPGANFDIHLTLNGAPVDSITVDTSRAAQWTIEYSVTDQSGNTSTATRTLDVYDPNSTSTPDLNPAPTPPTPPTQPAPSSPPAPQTPVDQGSQNDTSAATASDTSEDASPPSATSTPDSGDASTTPDFTDQSSDPTASSTLPENTATSSDTTASSTTQ